VRGEADDVCFTSYLVQGLQTGAADVNGDGQVGMSELTEYLGHQFALRGHAQRPRQWIYREPDDFIIAHNPSKAVPSRLIKWDLIFGTIMAPSSSLFLAEADFRAPIGLSTILIALCFSLLGLIEPLIYEEGCQRALLVNSLGTLSVHVLQNARVPFISIEDWS
jgi:hypothetical protein